MRIIKRYEKLLLIAYNDPERFVAFVKYMGEGGRVTERTISPIKYVDHNHLLAWCLGRDALRSFKLNRIIHVRLRFTADVLPPEGVSELMRKRRQRVSVDRSTETKRARSQTGGGATAGGNE